ncbi:EamA family transporter [Rhodococcus maanshanensis]|uniref:EamA family transporter n=1 Tax=Rhodococcus maanshanensis TaxID=183556 RepID=UPI0009FADC81|nr:DMT family transporter [Rhodococcus maanshanensis]
MTGDADVHSSAAAAIRTGTGLSVLSAFTFGLSGPFAKSLMGVGWSPGGTVLARIAGAAVVMLVVAAIADPAGLRTAHRHARTIVLYGLMAVAGVQASFFLALQYLSVGVALMIQFLAPLLVIGWAWATRGERPGAVTLLGTGLALAGAVGVLDMFGSVEVSLAGVAWSAISMVCLACFFVISDRTSETFSPLVLTATGMSVGAVAIGCVGLLGVLPLSVTAAETTLGSVQLAWFVPLALLILVSTVVAYLSGSAAVARIGPTLTSLILLTEVLFAVLASLLLLGESMSPVQIVGGAGVLGGIALARLGGAGGRRPPLPAPQPAEYAATDAPSRPTPR